MTKKCASSDTDIGRFGKFWFQFEFTKKDKPKFSDENISRRNRDFGIEKWEI